MNKTQNYQLSQWEAGDRVQRTDFNADNAKIDAAIYGVRQLATRSRFTKLWEMTLTTSADEIIIPLTGIDWSKWDKVHLEILATNGAQMEMYFNEYVWSTQVFYVTNSSPNFTPRYTFYPGFRADRQLEASFVDKRIRRVEPISSLQRLIVRGSDTMSAGGKFILWGEE